MSVHHDDDDHDEGTLDDLDAPAAPATPYAATAHRYLAAGWDAVLPLPARAKQPPPTGYTGELGHRTSAADVQAWIDGGLAPGRPAGNIALRLPPHVVGIDVDAYGGKVGAATYALHLAQLGPLPPTWTSTSRPDDGTSGIRLYRLPVIDDQQQTAAGWPGELGPGVELIRTGHRYMVCAPSEHPNGGTYRWTRPDGVTAVGDIPTPGDLPMLPLPWVTHLAERARVSPGRADLGPDEALGWLTAHQGHTQPHQPPCRLVKGYIASKVPALTGATGGSRHDAMLQATARLAHAAAEGHTGILTALQEVRGLFTASAGTDSHRDIRGEWDRAVLGAVQIAAHAAADPATVDPCDIREDPLAGLIPTPSPQEQPSCPTTATTPSNGLSTTFTASPTSSPAGTATTPSPTSPGATSAAPSPTSSSLLEEAGSSPSTYAAASTTTEDEAAAAEARAHQWAVREALERLRVARDAKAAHEAELRAQQPAAPFDADTLGNVLQRPPEPAMRADGLVPWEASVLLVAKRKSGKTTMLLNYARSLLTGEPFLGRFPVIPVTGRVAFVNYEVSGRQLARWADEVGVDRDRLYLVNLRGRRNPLGDPVDQAELAGLIRAQECETVIVDPFGRAYTGQSQNDAGEVGQWLVNLDYFARTECGAKDLVLAVHAGWNGERTRGSSALEDWADTIVTLTRDEEDDDAPAYVKAMGRDVDVDEDALDFDPATRRLTMAGTGGRKAKRDTRKLDKLMGACMAVLTEHPGIGVLEVNRQLRAIGAPFTDGEESKALRTLVDRGLVEVTEGPRRSKLHRIKVQNTPDSSTTPDYPRPTPTGVVTTTPDHTLKVGGSDEGQTAVSTPEVQRAKITADGVRYDPHTAEVIGEDAG